MSLMSMSSIKKNKKKQQPQIRKIQLLQILLTCFGGDVWCKTLGWWVPVHCPQRRLHQAGGNWACFPEIMTKKRTTKKIRSISVKGRYVVGYEGKIKLEVLNALKWRKVTTWEKQHKEENRVMKRWRQRPLLNETWWEHLVLVWPRDMRKHFHRDWGWWPTHWHQHKWSGINITIFLQSANWQLQLLLTLFANVRKRATCRFHSSLPRSNSMFGF